MKHESISQNLYSEHNKFHTEICVFTVSDAHIQCAYQRQADQQGERERESVCVSTCVCLSVCMMLLQYIYPVTSVFLEVCVS